MFGSIVALILIPFINTSQIRSTRFRPIYKKLFWFFVANFVILGWIGGQVVETPFVEIGQFSTVFYFFFIFVIIPISGLVESALVRN
jgi:ubiquinol-cytochrome c reductase cytochrome b subunit